MREFRKTIFIILVLMIFIVPVFGQEGTEEAPDVAPVEDVVEDGDTLDTWLDFVKEMVQYIIPAGLVLYGLYFLGNSVPQSVIDENREAAKRTESPVDDIVWQVIDALNKIESEKKAIEAKMNIVKIGDVINTNPFLHSANKTSGNYGGIRVDTPAGWTYYHVVGQGAKTHPTTAFDGSGLRMLLNQVDGNFGLEQDVRLSPDHAYELRVVIDCYLEGESIYDKVELKAKVIYKNNHELNHDFTGQMLAMGEKKYIFAIDPAPADGDYTIRVWLHVKDASLLVGSNAVWKSIELVPVS